MKASAGPHAAAKIWALLAAFYASRVIGVMMMTMRH